MKRGARRESVVGPSMLAALFASGLASCGTDAPVRGQLPQASRIGPKRSFLHHDAQGTVVATSDDDGALSCREAFLPFGSTSRTEGGGCQAMKYTGQLLDEGTGLYYYNARYYNPAIARFISVDSYQGVPEQPQSQNRYAYVTNNPYTFTDPTGHEPVGQCHAPRARGPVASQWGPGRTVRGEVSDASLSRQWARGAETIARDKLPLALGGIGRAPAVLLFGGTHRTAAIAQVVQSGNLGKLKVTDVVGSQGETVGDVARMVGRGRLKTANGFFDSSKAADLAESMRRYGYASKRRPGMDPDLAYRDDFGRLAFEKVSPARASRMSSLNDLGGFRDFVNAGR